VVDLWTRSDLHGRVAEEFAARPTGVPVM
jgi:hypothetical protein